MKRNIKSLIGFSMGATNGEIGKVKEFYFDDLTWTVRYVIVETGNWLNGRKVLIAPEALLTPDWKNEVFPVNLTKEKIKNSPNIDTEQPVSRQHEIEMYEYYPWTSYWGGGIWGGGMGVSGMMTQVREPLVEAVRRENSTDTKDADGDPHLRSTAIEGYHIHTTDDEIGHVSDFIIDDNTWQILYFVIDAHNWFGGKKVLIPVGDINGVKWENSKVIVNITTDAVKNSKLFNESEFRHMENNEL